LVQVTLAPTLTVMLGGLKAKPLISTALPAPVEAAGDVDAAAGDGDGDSAGEGDADEA